MDGASDVVIDGTKDQQIGFRPSLSCIDDDEEEKSENIKSSNLSQDKNLFVISDQIVKSQSKNAELVEEASGSIDALAINQEGSVEKVHDE